MPARASAIHAVARFIPRAAAIISTVPAAQPSTVMLIRPMRAMLDAS